MKLHCKSQRFCSIYPSPDWYVSRIGLIHFRPLLLNWNPVISVELFLGTFLSVSCQIQFKRNIFFEIDQSKQIIVITHFLQHKRKFPRYNLSDPREILNWRIFIWLFGFQSAMLSLIVDSLCPCYQERGLENFTQVLQMRFIKN